MIARMNVLALAVVGFLGAALPAQAQPQPKINPPPGQMQAPQGSADLANRLKGIQLFGGKPEMPSMLRQGAAQGPGRQPVVAPQVAQAVANAKGKAKTTILTPAKPYVANVGGLAFAYAPIFATYEGIGHVKLDGNSSMVVNATVSAGKAYVFDLDFKYLANQPSCAFKIGAPANVTQTMPCATMVKDAGSHWHLVFAYAATAKGEVGFTIELTGGVEGYLQGVTIVEMQ